MERIYLDNGATSFPKAPGVSAAMTDYIERVGANVARGGYESAYSAAERVMDTREKLATLFGAESPKNIIFTGGMTLAINMLLLGLLKPGDHALVSSMEHNAVMRPLTLLAERGVSFDAVQCDKMGRLDPDAFEKAIRPNTRCAIVLHASNVCGTLMPVAEIGEICKRHGIRFIIDAAQTAGVFDVDMKAVNADAIAAPGHKSLLGPPGIGCFAISEQLASELSPLICGGTGSRSDSEETPDFMPDKFEAGTLNLAGIYGLYASLSYIEARTLAGIRAHELSMAQRFLDGIAGMTGVRLVGLPSLKGRAAVISLDFAALDNAEAAFILESQYGIMTRCGLHCAPRAHKSLGTYPKGTVRFVPGYNTSEHDIDFAVSSIKNILEGVHTK